MDSSPGARTPRPALDVHLPSAPASLLPRLDALLDDYDPFAIHEAGGRPRPGRGRPRPGRARRRTPRHAPGTPRLFLLGGIARRRAPGHRPRSGTRRRPSQPDRRRRRRLGGALALRPARRTGRRPARRPSLGRSAAGRRLPRHAGHRALDGVRHRPSCLHPTLPAGPAALPPPSPDGPARAGPRRRVRRAGDRRGPARRTVRDRGRA